jgi:DNA phosphorothioation-dependent restriction protein DptH
MSQFIKFLTTDLTANVGQWLAEKPGESLRVIYSGPPFGVLEEIFASLQKPLEVTKGASTSSMPVFLLDAECTDPPHLSSARCSQSYLTAVRTAGTCDAFLALKDSAESVSRSLATSVTRIGIQEGIERLEDWSGKQLVEELSTFALRRFFKVEKDLQDAKPILASALKEAWILDDRFLDRRHAWKVLRRLCDTQADGVPHAYAFLSILGLPPCENQADMGSKAHGSVLARLGELLDQRGFTGTFELLAERAAEGMRPHLDCLKDHLLVQCSTPQDFLMRPCISYSPLDDEGGEPPKWWTALTLEAWEQILDNGEVRPKTGVNVECLGDMVPAIKGMPTVFLGTPRFRISLPDESASNEVRLSRASGRKQLEHLAILKAVEPVDWLDTVDMPEHDPYLRYRFELDGGKPVTLNVIAIDQYGPGISLYCRSANKVAPFKLNKKAKDQNGNKLERFESELRVNGVGSHQLDLYLRSGMKLGDSMIGHEVDSDQDREIVSRINLSNERHAVCVIETDEECHYDFVATSPDGRNQVSYRVWISAADHTPTGATSEFDSLIQQNRGDTGSIQVEIIPSRLGDLSLWALAKVDSLHPLVLGPDYLDKWHIPEWAVRPVLSGRKLILDPRPPVEEFAVPEQYVKSRNIVLEHLRAAGGQEDDVPVELLKLGELMDNEEFSSAVCNYLDAYAEWVAADPQRACWADVVTLHDIEAEGDTLYSIPYACLLSPLHPLRLGWQCRAQAVMKQCLEKHARCPAASMLDPGHFPDCMVLHCMTATGRLVGQGFISVASSSDYWGVLWNCDKINEISNKQLGSVFSAAFGLEIHGLQTGFSVQQVVRSLVEVGRLSSARSTLRVAIMSDTTGSSSCNEGIETWALGSLGPEGDEWFAAGGNALHVHDLRAPDLQPEQSALASLINGTAGMVRWFDLHGRDETSPPSDLTVIAHLGTGNHSFHRENLRSPVDRTFLSRWRLRKQLAPPGNSNDRFIAESRVGRYSFNEGDGGLGDKVGKCSSILEHACSEYFDSYLFAPRLHTIEAGLKHARYCAVSSSNVDAPCFFDGTRSSYLWDYDLPSYGRKAGENSGYFLLAKESPTMIRAVQSACRAIAPRSEISDEKIESMLKEVSRRGMPTLKKLTVGGSASLGELGMLVALRLLQSEFEANPAGSGIAPVQASGDVLNLVIPVDPFKNHFEDLRAALQKKSGERPDLIVVSIRFVGGQPVGARVTPIEVKARSSVMNANDRRAALGQAKSLSELLKSIRDMGQKHELWGIAWRSLITSWLDYAFRVYGQLDQFLKHSDWSKIHESVLAAVMSGALSPDVDERGRLVVIDLSTASGPVDMDGDGFKETIALSHSDGFAVLNSEHRPLMAGIEGLLGDWELSPARALLQPKLHNGSSPAAITEDPVNAVTGAKYEDNKEQTATIEKSTEAKAVDQPAVTGPADNRDEPNSGESPSQGLRFKVGTVKDAFQSSEVFFFPANTQLNQLNVGIVGDLGMGKTQLIQSFIHQLRSNPSHNRGSAPRILIFDYKKDYSKPDFVKATGARVVQPIDIPLSLFDTRGSVNPEMAWLDRSNFFSDVLDKVYSGIGPVQQVKLMEAVEVAYAAKAGGNHEFPTLNDVFNAYTEVVDGKIDAPYAIMKKLVAGRYFTSDPSKVQSFSDFLDGVVVINLGALGQDDRTKNMLVAIFLNLFYEHMLTIPKKPFIGSDPQLRFVDAMLLVDEANNIMKYEFDVLKKILLEGREFGAGVMLSSQYLSHFRTAHENYIEPLLTWLVHKVPNVTVKELESLGLSYADSSTVHRIKSLERHECLYKTFDVEGKFIRAIPFYELISEQSKSPM